MITTTAPKPAFRFHPLLWSAAAAMLVTAEVNWGPEDFAAFALMLTALCLAVEAAFHWLATPLSRAGAGLLAVAVFLIVWAELAVGLFD